MPDPAAFAAQARELVEKVIMQVTTESRHYDSVQVLQRLPNAIAAALGAVCDAARGKGGRAWRIASS